ncbi:SH3 domain-binding glutamic acid-rich-like protein 3 [Leucoraja erinacea]|uniref:SH3 domain-binding glutamic acid-rich-like protein 3 n=1 Tax=Leucoraja erinaceus TaxID=7782 RepID=UPI0024556FDC|nr:SH3 domain-binding glutamic acid-rich-like protein 3 [Leucoraja erinacea]
MCIVIYYSSITATTSLDKHQLYIFNRLDGMKIKYRLLDLAQDSKLKDEMRSKIGNPDAQIPQIFNGDHYCGDYAAFEQAVECEMIEKFLKLESAQQQK